jgi:trigger factor
MQVSVEVLKGLERKMSVSVPTEQLEQKIHKRLLELAPKVKIAGFRPGKVPMEQIRRMYGDSVRNEALSEVLQTTYQTALQQEELIPVGPPKIQIVNQDNNQKLEYEAKFEIFPKLELKELTDVELKELKVEISEQDIDKMLHNLREQQAKWVPVETPAKVGDRVKIDFEGVVDGETFAGGSGKDVVLSLGSNTAIPGFEKGIEGNKAGDDIEFNLQFPDAYHKKELAGKSTHIKVKIHQVLEQKLPELNDDLAEQLGVKEGGVEKLKEEVRQNMEQDLQTSIKNRLKEQVIEKMLSNNPIDLPKILIGAELENIKKQSENLNHQGDPIKTTPKLEEQWLEIAKKRVHLSLLFREFITIHQLKADPARVNVVLRQMAAPYKDPQSVINWYRGSQEHMAMIEAIALEEQIIEELIKQATIIPEPIKYKDLLNQNKTQPTDAPIV